MRPPFSAHSIPLLINRASGSSPSDPVAFAAAIDARLAAEAHGPAELPVHAARAAARGHDVVAVAGGDGTLRAAAEALRDTPSALLVVPAGTLNHFARRIGIGDARAAGEALRGGRIESVPVGAFGEHLFLNTLTFGEYAHVLRVRGRWRRYLGKWPAAAGAAAFLLRLGARLLRRELPVRDPALEVFHARALTLHAQHRVDATADGEIFRLRTPLEIVVKPAGLRVLRPPQERGSNS